MLSIGGIQSNHARATAVAATYLGLPCHLILRNSRCVGVRVGRGCACSQGGTDTLSRCSGHRCVARTLTLECQGWC
jgi:1-aminocyclopropane-1-carboxylate deaminase/D-cysteine desulfhydrase-like pyridoxal-dependent ACC family enzyme